MAVIYVVTHDGGYEGQSLPVHAFADKDIALGFCIGSSESFCVTEVPVFPEMPKGPWYSQHQIWPPR